MHWIIDNLVSFFQIYLLSSSTIYWLFLAVFNELKTSKSATKTNCQDELNTPDPQQVRLDRMLTSEGILVAENANHIEIAVDQNEHGDYNRMLTHIRDVYKEKINGNFC